MKVAILHSANQGFFPRFYMALRNSIEKAGNECILIVPKSGVNVRNSLPGQKMWGSRLNWHVHYLLYKITGLQDIYSFFSTLHLIRLLDKEKPDLIHLHVVNDKNMNMPLLVRYVNKRQIPVVWTMHDCRAFTGRCAYFDEIGCERWITGCGNCPQRVLYEPTWIDASHQEWTIRKRWHVGIDKLHIVTPSQWLSDYVKMSFFSNKKISVIHNGIDLSVFAKKSTIQIRENNNISSNIKIVLGVSAFWEVRKGLKYFLKLAEELDEKYLVVLIGHINEEITKTLSNKILYIQQTSSTEEIIAWYQTASVFVNPTLADNFPTTNIESLAAGTPVVTFKTGGSAESINKDCGIAVKKGDYNGLRDAIIHICNNLSDYSVDHCKQRAENFSLMQYDRYVDLYNQLIKN